MHVCIFRKLVRMEVLAQAGHRFINILFFSTHTFYFKGGRWRKKSTLLPSPQINWTVFWWWKLKVEGKKLYWMGLLQCWCTTLRLCLSFLTHCCCFIKQFLSGERGWFMFPFLTFTLYFKTTYLFRLTFFLTSLWLLCLFLDYDHNDNHKYDK